MTDDEENRSANLIACAIVCQVISGLFVGARFYSRSVVTRALVREDYCILASWILSLGYTIPSAISGFTTMGRHLWTVDPETMKTHMMTTYINTIFYSISLTLSKVSILLLYLRILAYSYARRAALAILVIVVIYSLFGIISTSTVCTPVKSFWDPEVEGHCHPGSFMWAVIGCHIGTDFLMFLLPMPVVYRMTLPPGQKFSVMLAFGLGFILCLVSTLRAIRIHQLYETTDITWDYVEVANWTSVELNLSILVPCIIVLKPLLAKIFPSLSTSRPPESPRDAPRTIGSDPTGFGRAYACPERGAEQSEKSSLSDYKHPREETRHVEHSTL